MESKKLPVGIENFEEIRTQDFYYVDKTSLISELLNNWGKVNLFTRPRRFGKSLNMSMLKSFFEIGSSPTVFDGLKIAQEKELCHEYMGKFPVIFVSLKDVSGDGFETACAMLRAVIGNEALRFQFLLKSENLSETEKKQYQALINVDDTGKFQMPQEVLAGSILTLSSLLQKHYSHKVIIMVDEYDVPLDKAFQSGYYTPMVMLVRNIFSCALKSNDSLHFAVLTGCLRVSKESIFTGLNNPNILSITDARFSEHFGFTDEEVREMLSNYGLAEYYHTVKEWYDGYRFGNAEVYCPWDVIKYCYALRADRAAEPENYWSNTSGNSIVRRFIDKSDKQTQDEIERLIAGETIVKEVRQELTYNELDTTIDNLWSVLFTTGYLTQYGRIKGNQFRLAIPNREIRELFVMQVKEWFRETSGQDAPKLDAFCAAFPASDTETIEREFNDYLWNTISIRDTSSRKERKENFYHGILLGLLRHKENWVVKSNAESGDGYSDIQIEITDLRIGIIIEVKYAENGALSTACAEALKQIEEKKYAGRLLDDGMKTVIKYGIACYKKHCKVECVK